MKFYLLSLKITTLEDEVVTCTYEEDIQSYVPCSI